MSREAKPEIPTPANDPDNVVKLWRVKLERQKRERRASAGYIPPERALLCVLIGALAKSHRRGDTALLRSMMATLASLDADDGGGGSWADARRLMDAMIVTSL